MAQQPNVGELLQVIAKQQEQITQFLAMHQKGGTKTASQSAQQLPVLPDMEQFEMGEQHSNIEDWIDRFNFAIDCAAPTLPDELKVKLLMTKLAGVAYSEYSKSCLPKKVTEFTFARTMEKLKGLFGKPQSIWIDRYECLRAVKHDGEEFGMFINRQKRLLRDFNFKKLNEEQFNCLVLLLSLKAPNESILRSRILAKLAADGDQIKYDNVVEDLKVYLSTISEAKTLEQPPTTTKNIFAVKKGHKKREGSSCSSSVKSASSYGNLAQRGCWRCGVSHFPKKCNHLKTTCRKCNKIGHLERMCAKHQAWLKKNDDRIKDRKATNCVRIGALMLENGTQQKKLIEAPIGVNGNDVEFVMDMGTEVTVLCQESHRQIGSPKLGHCKEKAILHDGSTRRFLGKGFAKFSFGGQIMKGQFFVSEKGSKNLFGTDMMDKFGLLDGFKKNLKVVQQEETVQKELPAKSKSKNAQKNEGRSPTKHFAVGAKVITNGGSQPMQIGYVINRKGMMYDVHFHDGYTGRYHANNLEEYSPAKFEGPGFVDSESQNGSDRHSDSNGKR